MIEPGRCVVLHLGSPREQVFGLVVEVTSWGVTVRGIGLASIDEWIEALPSEEARGALTTVFFPMHRIERMALDEPAWGAPSVEQRFSARTGCRLGDWVARPAGSDP